MTRKITHLSGPDKGMVTEVPEQTIAQSMPHGSVTGNASEEAQLADEDAPSNAGKQAQSTDHQNSY
jgi:hypothetical protein